MSILWLIALGFGGVVYALFVLNALFGILSLRRKQRNMPSRDSRSISVVFAARNEEEWIGKTLSSLLAQNCSFEIIVVDDRSTDRTAEIVTEFAEKHPQVRLFRQDSLPAGVSPKKAALTLGINQSSGEIILTTDADCTYRPGWAESLADIIPTGGGMAIGQARFIIENDAPLWQRLQALDFAAQGVLSAGLAAAGTPFNCSGASLAFARNNFDKVKGWEGIERFISGDDELLMRRFVTAGIPVNVASGSDCVVLTRPPASLRELFHQRARWGSKTLHYPSTQKAVLSGVFLFYLALALTPLIAWTFSLFLAAIAAFAVKFAIDLALLAFSRPLYGDRAPIGIFLLAELLHPPVIVILAVIGAFGSFKWKGETYRTKGAA